MKTYAINPSMYVSIISDEYNKNLKELQSKAMEMRKSGMMVKDIAKNLAMLVQQFRDGQNQSSEYRDNQSV